MPRLAAAIMLCLPLLAPMPGLAAEKVLQLPPPSIAQWYRPANERQVWLHNMFKLRREMQAVEEYARLADRERAGKWAARLAEHYRGIARMVPEWKEKLAPDQAKGLEAAARSGDLDGVRHALQKLRRTCNDCHDEYRAVTALLYRAPDFSAISLDTGGEPRDYEEAMGRLSAQVNGIKIALEDDRPQAALDSLADLRAGLDKLGESCASCHKDEQPRERILGPNTQRLLHGLEEALARGDKKAAGRGLGEAAVEVCARCHGVHRTLSDLRETILFTDTP